MTKDRQGPSWWMLLTDVVLIMASVGIAYWLRYEVQFLRDVDFDHPLSTYVPFGLLYTLLMMMMFQIDRVYKHRQGRAWLDQTYSIINATAKSVVILLAATFVTQPREYSRLLLLEAGVVSILLLSIARLVENVVIQSLRARGVDVIRVIIVGAGEVGRTVMRTIAARPELGYEVIGFVDDNPEKGENDLGRFKAMGGVHNLPGLISENDVDGVLITLPWMYHRKIMSIVNECNRREVEARIVPDLFQMSLSRVDVDDLGGVPLIGVQEVGFDRRTLLMKRAIDVTGALLGLMLGAPLYALIALAIKLDSPGPVLFRQTRVGTKGRRFEIVKFRSMHMDAEMELDRLQDQNEVDGPIFKMKEDPRRTRVGRFLRRTSLDELPQLWNVLVGDMSLVGPRPPTPEEVEGYQEWHKRRLDGRPGMTGLWQVSGRSLLSFDESALLDIYYIENWTLWLDFKILLRTVPTVLSGEGAY